uniref:Chlorophyll a-b binding protein, chloroplastic n=1 Tax=Glycine max TaxID=3847 RepID=K7KSZ4_SOYBN
MHVVVVKEANLSTGIGADNQKTMAVAIGRSFSIQPGSLFNNKSLDRGSPAGRLSWLGDGAAATPRYRQTCVGAQQRPTWLPGLDPPPHLDGTLAGDFGFDPLGLAEDPASLRWYVQAELVHCRFAMLGVFGILVTDLLRVTGISKIPVWFEAGAVKYDFANTKTLFLVQLVLMGFVETKRYMDFVSPGSQAKEGSFFGLEASLKGLEPGYLHFPITKIYISLLSFSFSFESDSSCSLTIISSMNW